jgi:hypothetical protein
MMVTNNLPVKNDDGQFTHQIPAHILCPKQHGNEDRRVGSRWENLYNMREPMGTRLLLVKYGVQ